MDWVLSPQGGLPSHKEEKLRQGPNLVSGLTLKDSWQVCSPALHLSDALLQEKREVCGDERWLGRWVENVCKIECAQNPGGRHGVGLPWWPSQ